MRGAQAAGFANKLKRTPHRTSVSLQERLTFLELILAYAAQGADKIVGQISHFVPGAMPLSGSPADSSYTQPQTVQV